MTKPNDASYVSTATDGGARTGTVTTARGAFETPCFMPVGTRGAVVHLSAADYEAIGAQVVLGNTYHLMLKPGADVIAGLGGLGRFAGWNGHTLTDSGGFQVFSLNPKVTDEGATFASTYDGSKHLLSPEGATQTQALLGADIAMVLDVCPALPATDAELRKAVSQTARWAARGRAEFLAAELTERRASGLPQAQFGIVQGGVDEVMRAESVERTLEVGFDGYAVGGLSVGESRAEMLPALAAATALLPTDKARYLMGVSDPIGLVESVALGVDMFDCVLPTRLARHGTVLTSQGRVNMKNAKHVRSDEPLDAACGCAVCARHSRGYIRHLFTVKEPTAGRLLSLHNLTWTLDLMAAIRGAVAGGTFEELRRSVNEVWAGDGTR